MIDFRDLATPPKVWLHPRLNYCDAERIAEKCGGLAVEAGLVLAVYTPEQFRPLVTDLRRQANGKA